MAGVSDPIGAVGRTRRSMPPTELNATVIQRIEVSPGLVILRVVPDGWELPDFEAGQFAVLGLPPTAPRTIVMVPLPAA